MEVRMHSGINFDIFYELHCGRVIVMTAPDGRYETCYWLDDGQLVKGSGAYRRNSEKMWRRLSHEAHEVVIPYDCGFKFAVMEKDYINVYLNC